MTPQAIQTRFQHWISTVKKSDLIDFKAHGKYQNQERPWMDVLAREFSSITYQKEYSFELFTLDGIDSLRFREKSDGTIQVDYFQNRSQRYLIDFGYRGTLFHGSQRQPSPKRSVQNELENVLQHIYQTRVEITPASRTDRGVHAFHNYAHFDVPNHPPIENLSVIMQRMMPDDIIIHQILPVSSIFHARYDALSKKYHYRVRLDLDVESMHSAWSVRKVDPTEIPAKLKLFEGIHDFKNFSKYRDVPSTNRQITALNSYQDEGTIILEFIGPSFLRYMIRMIVGAIIKHDIKTIKKGLENPLEPIPKHLAPSHGLYLMDIDY